jgi:hypothetical protein
MSTALVFTAKLVVLFETTTDFAAAIVNLHTCDENDMAFVLGDWWNKTAEQSI